MPANVKPVPEGFHTVTPYLIVRGASRLIDFLKQAFDAQEVGRYAGPDGTIMHAAVRIGDSMVELSDAQGEWQPQPAYIHLYVDDVDAVYAKALRAGGTSLREPTDQFYGDRESGVKDPFGNQWFIATRKEEVSEEEMRRRMEQMKQQRKAG
jgi:PhnB protein